MSTDDAAVTEPVTSAPPEYASFSEIIDAFGGPPKFGPAIGIKVPHAGTMKNRDKIPDHHWNDTVAAAERAGIPGVTLEALAKIAAAKKRAPASEGES